MTRPYPSPLNREIERLERQYADEVRVGMVKNARVTKRMLDRLIERREAGRPTCSNCGEKVNYGSEHCRGNDELHAWWICEKPDESGPEEQVR